MIRQGSSFEGLGEALIIDVVAENIPQDKREVDMPV
jgi:hypothetical protein